MDTERRSPAAFFLLVLALSVPFWIVDAWAGGRPAWLPINLPLSALMAILPAFAALVLTYRSAGAGAAKVFARQAFVLDRRALGWLALACALYPLALVAEYWLLVIAGRALPDIAFSPVTAILLLALFFIGGFGEEIGWQGYAFPALERRYGALAAAVIIAVFWMTWHIVPFVQTGHDTGWIAWQCLTMLPLRLITVWLFLHTGRSVLVAASFHAFGNLAQFLFPHYGSHYDPAATFAVLSLIALAILPSLIRKSNEGAA